MNQKVIIMEPHEIDVVTCEHCQMEFVLYAVLGTGEDRELHSQVDDMGMYCPYCGKKTKKD